MIKSSAVLTCALLVTVCSTACESSDPNEAQAMTDARVQAGDAAQAASGGRLDAGSVDTDAGSSETDAGRLATDGGHAERDASSAERDASTGGPKDAGTARDARADASCPPTCLRAYTCATSCTAPAFDNGCCACPAGTIDTITCNSQHGGCGTGAPGCGEEGAACCDPAPCDGPNFCHGTLSCCGATCAASCGDAGGNDGSCNVPCTGAAPFPSVVQACYAITSESACLAYKASEFPYGCRWVTPRTARCPPIP